MRKAFTLLLLALLMTGCGIIYRQPVFQATCWKPRTSSSSRQA